MARKSRRQVYYKSMHNGMPGAINGAALGGGTKSTFVKLLTMMKRCDVIVLVFAAIILAVILPASVVECAKLETQIKLLLNDDDLLSEQQPQHATRPVAGDANDAAAANSADGSADNHEHYKLYRSELKRLSYETIHRIMRDEDESTYRRVEIAPHNYQKRSFAPTKQHEIVRRSAPSYVLQAGRFLDLSKSNRTEFSMYENATAITEINLRENRLERVSLAAFANLKAIDLSQNVLTELPIADNNTLISLNLNGNRISQGVAPVDYYLRELHLSANEIDSLSALNLSLLNGLETLDLSCNRIRTIETSFFPQRMRNLKHLNLAHNRLGSIYRETFYNLLSLSTLLLPHNNITDIDYETFLALPNLQYLDLSYNQLKGESIRALQGIPDLMGLSIAYNPNIGASMQEFVASWSLKELDASGTGLCQIPAALAQSVRTLKLTDNWLKIINCGDLDSYPLLQYLDLSHSRIDDIEDDALGRLEILEVLFLDHNNLVKVPLSLPTSLEHLFLQHNRIMDIPEQAFIGLRNLQTLDLSGNQLLLYLPALPLPKLLTLNLQSAGLKGVSQAIVHTLPRLRDLLLDDNPIKCSDLLGIAEWASPCRLPDRVSGGGGSGSTTIADSRDAEQIVGGQQQQQQQQPQLVVQAQPQQQQAQAMLGKIDLKRKFVQMHNFYENFKSSCGSTAQYERGGEDGGDGGGGGGASMPACALDLDDELKVDARNFNFPTAATTTTTTTTTTTSSGLGKHENAEAASAKVEVWKVYKKKIEQAKAATTKHIKATSVRKEHSAAAATTTITTTIASGSKITSAAPIMPTKSSGSNAMMQQDETAEKWPASASASASAVTVTATASTLAATPSATAMPATKQQITEMPAMAQRAAPTPTTTTTTTIKPTTTTTVAAIKASKRAGVATTATKTHANQDEAETKQTSQTNSKEVTISGNAIEATTMATTTTTTFGEKLAINYYKVAEQQPETLQQRMMLAAATSAKTRTTTRTRTTTTKPEMKMMPSTSSLGPSNAWSAATTVSNTLLPATTTTTTTTMAAASKRTMGISPQEEATSLSAIKSSGNYAATSGLSAQTRQGSAVPGPGAPPVAPPLLDIDKAAQFDGDAERSTPTSADNGMPLGQARSAAATLTPLPPHRHEPMQVHPKDRHLIGTPILMHRGQNMLLKDAGGGGGGGGVAAVAPSGSDNDNASTATLAVRQAHAIDAKWPLAGQQEEQEQQRQAEEIKTAGHVSTPAAADKQTTPAAVGGPTTATEAWTTSGRSTKQQQQPQPHEDKRKLSLTMKKMTFSTTKHATTAAPPAGLAKSRHQAHANAARENEAALGRSVQPRRLYTELKPSSAAAAAALSEPEHYKAAAAKHSTVNTPVVGQPQHELLSFADEQQHEQLLQALEHDGHANGGAGAHEEPHTSSSTTKHGHGHGGGGGSKTAQWLDTRQATRSGHPGLVILLSSSLFVVLLLGLMHVYRCDVPWRRHLPQPRPHQRRPFGDDDAHSFLSYQQQQQGGGGVPLPAVQKWHHSTRAQPPYGSPLHNLQVRELQQTSAVDVGGLSGRDRKYYSRALAYSAASRGAGAGSYSGSDASSSRSNSSQSSAASIAGIGGGGGDDAFYIETAPDAGQPAEALHSDFLPMELLNVAARRSTPNDDDDGENAPATAMATRSHMATASSSLSAAAATLNDADDERKRSSAKLTPSTRKFGIW